MACQWFRGNKVGVWFGTTCPDTLAPSHLNLAVTAAGAVANKSESHKRSKYIAIDQTHYFVPVAVETFGALGEEATAFFNDLGGRIATVTKERRALEFLMQRVSVTVQTGNAVCVLGTISEDCQKLDGLFYF